MTDEELSAAIREVQQRARSRFPRGPLGVDGVEAADLMPLVHARDAAQGKVAAIGTVNPRPDGPLNSAIQGAKRAAARALDWHVREQVEFNRAAMACVEATISALAGVTRGIASLAAHQSAQQTRGGELGQQLREIETLCQAQAAALEEFRSRQSAIDRGICEQTEALRAQMARQEETHHQLLQTQHQDFERALDQRMIEVQRRLWEDLARVREEFEALIHREVRLVRQREALPQVTVASPLAEPLPKFDWLEFARRFRGPEERIRSQQARYAQHFGGTAGDIVDLGCGRGEFLEALRERGLAGIGVDANPEAVALCRSRGLRAECSDLFAYLEAPADGSIAAVFCAQVVEHLAPARVAGLIRLLGRKLRPGAPVVVETPNPECLAIFATYFYSDPTHTRPIPAPLLRFYLEEAGFGSIAVEPVNPVSELIPSTAALPRELFGGLDYAIFARRL